MITVLSHGFKYGRPDANIYFDVSYFKNPWRDEKIRTEQDPKKRKEKILKFMMEQKDVEVIVKYFSHLIGAYEEAFPGENIRVAFCCSAGEYRSPTIAELVYQHLKRKHKANVQLKQSPFSKLPDLVELEDKKTV